MSKKAIENIKSVILVVLFLTTILLLYLIWGDKQTGVVKMSDLIPVFGEEAVEIDPKDIICPSKIYYTAGDGAFWPVVKREAVFKESNDVIKELSGSTEIMATEITKNQYDEAVKNYESVQLLFGYSVPFTEYCNLFEISRSSTFANIANFDAMAFSAAAKDSVLIADEAGGKYYRLLSEKEQSLEKLMQSSLGKISYFEAASILGLGGGKLFPLNGDLNLTQAAFENDYNGTEEKRQEIARQIFGENFSFVRRIADSFENYTFMYGYGQRSLTLNADGNIEYKNEAGDGESKGFFGDLKTAAEFAERVGGFIETNGAGFVLKNAQTSGSGKTAIYTYYFDQQSDDEFGICRDSGYAMIITVEKGSVSYYKRNSLAPQNSSSAVFYSPVYAAANAMAADADSTESFESLAENFTSMQPALYAKDGILIPVWQLHLNDGSNLCFDLYTGEKLN